ncbi:MAG: PA0069 family radical SAM protein [Myxococcales bacterium]|nr:PA0069 family radical SAM protein [Myxococcales bacterium]
MAPPPSRPVEPARSPRASTRPSAHPSTRLPTDPSTRPSTHPSTRLRASEPPALRPARKGRGARTNPTGRFEVRRIEPDLDALASSLPIPAGGAPEGARPEQDSRDEGPSPHAAPSPTLALRDPSRSAITTNQSPDLPFDASLNPYRGCEHGCAYCYARPTHEYLGYSAGLDFETKILVKEDAPQLLRRELSRPSWQPRVVAISGVTDAYQPLERKLELTRRCVEVFAEFRNPITIITKNALVVRDIDLFRRLAEYGAISVALSLTTLDRPLQRALEPRASSPDERLRAIETLARAGIPTGVMVAPIIPGLTDEETPALLAAAASAGARRAGYIVLRLPHGLRALFDDWLLTHRPLRRDKVLHRLESLRGGRLNDPRFGSRLRGEGIFARQIADVFRIQARRLGLDAPHPPLSTAAFRRPGGEQLVLGL